MNFAHSLNDPISEQVIGQRYVNENADVTVRVFLINYMYNYYLKSRLLFYMLS